MRPCDVHQAQMLAYLYDLLEAGERAALEAHLATCSTCQSALAHARNEQGLFAAAAKVEFPQIRFEPPPIVHRMPSPTIAEKGAATRHWSVWAMALSVVLAIGVLGTLLGGTYGMGKYTRESALAHAKEQVEDLQARWESLAGPLKAKQDSFVKLQSDAKALDEKINAQRQQMEKSFEKEHLFVALSGPSQLIAGMPNDFTVQTLDLNGKPVKANVHAKLVDDKQPEKVRQIALADDGMGKYRLHVPADVDLKPDSSVNLVLEAITEGGEKVELQDRFDAARAPLITHLATDKPIYQPGEVLAFRSLTLDRYTLRPVDLPEDEQLRLMYSISNKKGDEIWHTDGVGLACDAKTKSPIIGPDGKPVRGVGAFSFPIPFDFPGGEYVLTVREKANRFTPVSRKVIVHRYEKPRLRKELDFGKKSYGPGEELTATCRVASAETTQPLPNARVHAKLTIDGKSYDANGQESANGMDLNTDANGVCTVRVRLPREIDKGDANLSLQINDGGNVETLLRSVPLVVNGLYVEFFPEGGDLVAGLPNRVYFQARTPLGKPAELTGSIVDADGMELAKLQTLNDAQQQGVNQGQGKFVFTPKAGAKYALKLLTPVGVDAKYEFPVVKADGMVLTTPKGVGTNRDGIGATLQSTTDGSYAIGLYCRGRLIDQDTVQLKAGTPANVQLKPHHAIGGVYRITAYRLDGQNRVPVAERLVYRAPTQTVSVDVQSQKQSYQPGDRATLNLTAKDENGQPTAAFVMVSVVNKSVLNLADNKNSPSMPTHFLLTQEVREPEELEYADFLLTDHPLATEALDLLLGTQGWRRFAEQRLPELRAQPSDDNRRLLASLGDGTRTSSNAAALRTAYAKELTPQLEQLNQLASRESAGLRDQLQKAQTELATLQGSLGAILGPLEGQRATLARTLNDAQARLSEFDHAWGYYTGWSAGVTLIAVGMGLMLSRGLRRLPRLQSGPTWGYASVATMACLGLGAMVIMLRDPGVGVLPTVDVAWGPKIDLIGIGAMAQKEAAVPDRNNNGRPNPGGQNNILPAGNGMNNAGPKQPDWRNRLDPVPDRNWPDKQTPTDNRALSDRFKQSQRDNVERERGGRRDRGPGIQGNGNAPQDNKVLPQPLPPDGDPGKRAGGGTPGGPPQLLPNLPPDDGPTFRDPPPAPYLVREFAHQHRTAQPGVREDFTEVLYWHPLLVLPDGKGQISFDLADANTTYQATIYAHTPDGRLGASTFTFSAALAFNVEPKLPIELTSTDRLDLPITVTNATDKSRTVKVGITANNGQIFGESQKDLEVNANDKGRATFGVKPAVKEGRLDLTIQGHGDGMEDKVLHSIPVVPEGFPISGSKSDILEHAMQAEVILPESWISGTLKLSADVYPSTLADLEKGLEALLRDPHGCFEQTSSSNYPNALILDYLRETNQQQPAAAAHAKQLLAKGYQKLVSFECQNPASGAKAGYEWFGGAVPAHEALTAYGLMQFRDMARVHAVDQPMLDRTRQWLMDRRDGQGGFLRNPKAIDGFGRAPDGITNAYVVWALTEGSKDDDVTKELDALKKQAATSKDPYFLSLVANAVLNRNDQETAAKLLKQLAESQHADGYLQGATTSITGSTGRDLQVETTALGLLAWLKANKPEHQANVQKAVAWIGRQRNGQGGFGATQATILALKSLLTYARINKRTAEEGDLRLIVNNEAAAQLHFPAGAQEILSMALERAERHLRKGRNEVRVELTGNNAFPCTLSWSYQTTTPASARNCPMRLRTRLNRAAADEGDTVRLTATVGNVSGRGQGMTITILGLPAGLSLSEDAKQLQDLARPRENGTKPGLISAWETRGREVILYWRDFAPDAEIEINLDLVCRVPGHFTAPASCAYLYYSPDAKTWAEPLGMEIKAK